MIYYTFEKENIYYYGMIYVSKGRYIGYSKKRLYLIDVITDKNGFQYNQYKFVVENEI
jgi:outer membrane protein assembly factor BamB